MLKQSGGNFHIFIIFPVFLKLQNNSKVKKIIDIFSDNAKEKTCEREIITPRTPRFTHFFKKGPGFWQKQVIA